MTILVTGGAGFIGSNFVLDWLAQHDEPIVNLDKLTYAGNLNNLAAVHDDPRHHFVGGDIGDGSPVTRLLHDYRVRAVLNFAAESHVDRSIAGPAAFIDTSVVGTFHLLATGPDCQATSVPASASCMCRPMRCTVRSLPMHQPSTSSTLTRRTARVRPARRRRTTFNIPYGWGFNFRNDRYITLCYGLILICKIFTQCNKEVN